MEFNTTELMDTASTFIVMYGLQIVAAILIFFIGRIAAKLVSSSIVKVMEKKKIDKTVNLFVGKLVYIGLLVFVAVAALGQLGIQTASFVAIIGAAGLAIGLALQGTLSNFAAGVLIILFRPFSVGNFIEAAGEAGVVEEISIFKTILKTGDNKVIYIPNSSIMGGNITNYSVKDTRRVDMVIGIGYDDDIKKAKEVLLGIAAADSRILKDPAITVAVSELADSSINFVVRPWVNSADYWAVKFDFLESVKLRFDEENIGIPYPQMDVHFQQSDK